MSEVIVITSGKGGVGKTTTTANVGTGLAQLNKKVVLIDTDIGLRNLDVVMGLENRIVYNLVDVIEGNCRIKQALIKDKRYPNLSLLPSAQTRDKSAVSPAQFYAIRDADRIIGLLCAHEVKQTELIVNRLRMDMVKRGDMMNINDVTDILAIDLIGAVPDDEQIVISTNQGEPLVGSDCLAGKAFENICHRILGEEVPFLDLEIKSSVWGKLKEIFKKN